MYELHRWTCEDDIVKALVAYYSRTGTTRKAVKVIAEELPADIEEIHDTKKRARPIGWLRSGMDGAPENLSKIMELMYDPAGYDVVVIGTPIWAGKMSLATRTCLGGKKAAFNQVTFFITSGSGNIERCSAVMKEVLGTEPVATLSLRTKDVMEGDIEGKVREFVDSLKGTGE